MNKFNNREQKRYEGEEEERHGEKIKSDGTRAAVMAERKKWKKERNRELRKEVEMK